METLRYGQGKLLTNIGLCSLTAAFLLYILIYPEYFTHIPKLWILTTGIGHYLVTPVLVLLCLIVAWRGALILVGDRKALEATPEHLVLTTWWTSRRVAWADLGHAEITFQPRYKLYQLVVHYRSTGLFGSSSTRLSLGTTELHPDRYQELLDTLAALIERRGTRPPRAASPMVQAPAPREAEAPADTGGFDADAALARYLARKASGVLEAPPSAPPRAMFGRKGL